MFWLETGTRYIVFDKEKVVKLSYQANRCNVVLNVKIVDLDPYN